MRHQLSPEERERYRPHLALQSLGEAGQLRLKSARILCVGAGGLGSPLLTYLAAAGVGTLGLVDDDRVETANLQRQILYQTSDVSRLKTDAARERLAALNPAIEVRVHPVRLTASNAREIVESYDLVADGSDNFETRYLVNHTCLSLGKINVSASVSDFKGHCTVLRPPMGPCYHCLFPRDDRQEALLNCRERGILGVLPGVLGTIQAAEVLKIVLGIGTPLVGQLLEWDLLTQESRVYRYEKDPLCAVCGPAQLPEFSYSHGACGTAEVLSWEEWERLPRTAGALLLDVRETSERRREHRGGLHIPLSELETRMGELDPFALTAVYCQSGVRSAKAARLLKDRGFARVYSLAGGMSALRENPRASR